jgi:hypothetical protein
MVRILNDARQYRVKVDTEERKEKQFGRAYYLKNQSSYRNKISNNQKSKTNATTTIKKKYI